MLQPVLTSELEYDTQLVPSPAMNEFGYSVAVSGDTVVVGARGASSGTGSAYVYVRRLGVWHQQARLMASNAGTGDEFGCSVAISGDTIVVGARREASNATGVNGNQSNNSLFAAGAAYVFVRNGTNWSQQAYLKPSNPGLTQGIFFGTSVAVSGDTVVVGAPSENSPSVGVNGDDSIESLGVNAVASGSGAAYVFVRSGSTWTQQAYVKAHAVGINFYFGTSVAISGDTVVVGSPQDGGGCGVTSFGPIKCGAVFVFARTEGTWNQQTWLTASNKEGSDRFGTSVAIAGDTLVAGAVFEDSDANGVNGDQTNNAASNAGAGYVFSRQGNDWVEEAYLKSDNSKAFRRLGWSVATSGNYVLLGCYYLDPPAIFERNNGVWIQLANLTGNVELDDGVSLSEKFAAISEDTGVVGMPSPNMAFVFRLPLPRGLLLTIK